MPEQKVERKMVPETTVKKFLHEAAVPDRDIVALRQQLISQTVRLRPGSQKFEDDLTGVHGVTLTQRGGR